MKTVHEGVKEFLCSVCGKAFGQKGALTVHLRIHSGERPFSCEECGRTFTDKSSLYHHMETHQKVKPFPCEICGRRFGRGFVLKRHMNRHVRKLVNRVISTGENHTEILIQDSEPDLDLLAGNEEMSDVNDDEENDEYDEFVEDENSRAEKNST